MVVSEHSKELFWSKVNKTDDCWVWLAYKDKHGYGDARLDGKTFKAYRAAFIIVEGYNPEGYDLHHMCHNTSCVKPDHLEVLRRSHHMKLSRPRIITHCKRGHEFTPENTFHMNSGSRLCRECDRARGREKSKRKRAATRTERIANGTFGKWRNPKACHNALKTHCPGGHAYDALNTRLYKGSRVCITCERARDARRRAA